MREQAKKLVLQAFETARLAGKEDWRRMTIAVLKNRILQMTEGNFTESDYGVTSFREFVRQLGAGMLRVDESTLPVSLELLVNDESLGQELISEPAIERIRSDLWTSVMDYSSGRKFLWDADQGRARTVSSDDNIQDTLLMPTINIGTVASWREGFVQRYAGTLDEGTWQHLVTWKEKALSSKALPPGLLGAWNRELKVKVSELLGSWFSEHNIPAPTDMIKHSQARREDYLESLRKIVLDCVAVMNQSELAELKLPPSAVLRARITGPRKR